MKNIKNTLFIAIVCASTTIFNPAIYAMGATAEEAVANEVRRLKTSQPIFDKYGINPNFFILLNFRRDLNKENIYNAIINNPDLQQKFKEYMNKTNTKMDNIKEEIRICLNLPMIENDPGLNDLNDKFRKIIAQGKSLFDHRGLNYQAFEDIFATYKYNLVGLYNSIIHDPLFKRQLNIYVDEIDKNKQAQFRKAVDQQLYDLTTDGKIPTNDTRNQIF